MTDLVSCIVPVLNGAAYIAQALNSILGQTYRHVEVLVADDGSSDDTPLIVRRFGHPVRYLRQPQSGPAAARNLGLAHASGDYVAFLDADDLWHPRKVQCQLDRLRAETAVPICVAFVREFSGAHPADLIPEKPERGSGAKPGYVSGAVLAHRSAFRQLGFYDTSLRHGADLDWFLRARSRGMEISVEDKVLLYRRLHDSNFSRRESDRSRLEHLRVIRESLERRRRNQS